MRVGSWRTTDISIGDRNPTSINFANNGNQIVFINKIKYFQQSLGFLEKTMTEEEKEVVKQSVKKSSSTIKNQPKILMNVLKKTKNRS